MKVKNLVSQTFGTLTVTKCLGVVNSHARWLCTCTCGRVVSVLSSNLLRGLTRSCGQCQLHGHTRKGEVSPTYQSWKNMMTRCTCQSHKEYPKYGGAGIEVLSGWTEFKNFVEDLGLRPKGTTLGRILDSGNYELGNAFWQTRSEQNLARRNRNALLQWISWRVNPLSLM